MIWFKKKQAKELMTHGEIENIRLEAVKEIEGLTTDSLKILLKEGLPPDIVKLKLYNFLIEYNILDATLDKLYRKYLGIGRSISSNCKEKTLL